MFLIKRNKIHLDCFTKYASIGTDNPIAKASNFMPDWWRDTPKTISFKTEFGVDLKKPTIRGCLGFIDLYRSGVIMPLWSDINFKVEDDVYAYQFAHRDGHVIQHTRDQYPGCMEERIHFKFISPWILKEKTGVNFVLTSCIWSHLDLMPKLSLLTGVIEFKTNSSCHINGFASKENQPYQYDLQAGMPLIHLIPMSEKEVVPHIHILTDSEWNALNENEIPYKFFNWGAHRRKIKK